MSNLRGKNELTKSGSQLSILTCAANTLKIVTSNQMIKCLKLWDFGRESHDDVVATILEKPVSLKRKAVADPGF